MNNLLYQMSYSYNFAKSPKNKQQEKFISLFMFINKNNTWKRRTVSVVYEHHKLK